MRKSLVTTNFIEWMSKVAFPVVMQLFLRLYLSIFLDFGSTCSRYQDITLLKYLYIERADELLSKQKNYYKWDISNRLF